MHRSLSGCGRCGAVSAAGCVFIEGRCCCTQATSELLSALIGIEDVVIAGGPDRDTAGAVLSAVLSAWAVSVESEVVD